MSALSLTQIDIRPAVEAMNLEIVPELCIQKYQYVGIMAATVETHHIIVNPRMLDSTTYKSIAEVPVFCKALKWDWRRPYTSLIRWSLAHELGHFVQATRYVNLNEFYTEYRESVFLAQSMAKFDHNEGERMYRASKFEAEADEFANKYWNKVKILDSPRVVC